MSDSSQPQKGQIPPDFDQQRTETTDEERVAEMLSEYTIGRDDHKNAPAFVIRADEIQEVLTILRDDAGFDHLSLITPQEYEDRYESIIHLTKYEQRTHEVTLVVPLPKDDPVCETAEPVFRTADWHEREAYDLVGIGYEGTQTSDESCFQKPGRATRFL